ncbi:MAG: hypothetical protein V7754_21345 [Halioglobus sp.]
MKTSTSQRGAMMIEILITMAITVIGLWGTMEVQARLQKSEMETYQRSQSLILLDDISNRIEANRNNAIDYVTSASTPDYAGMGMVCNALPTTTQQTDNAEWCSALQGAAESVSGVNVGAMVGARGCVEEIGTGSGQYMVTVTWQGLTPIAAPPASVGCGLGLYNEPAGSGCTGELCRRFVTTMVRIPVL